MLDRIMGRLGIFLESRPVHHFHSMNYLRHTARRLEHLASLGFDVSGMSVLEVGAGIGDHSHYYLDRGCDLTITEARAENIRHLKRFFPNEKVLHLDLERPVDIDGAPFDVVHCYGLLYHLRDPEGALDWLARNTGRFLFLETCVSTGDTEAENITGEPAKNPTQAVSGFGCRPTRPWLFSRLKARFDHVYVPRTQPWHKEFPLDWSAPRTAEQPLKRAIFIASREPIANEMLLTELPQTQSR